MTSLSPKTTSGAAGMPPAESNDGNLVFHSFKLSY